MDCLEIDYNQYVNLNFVSHILTSEYIEKCILKNGTEYSASQMKALFDEIEQLVLDAGVSRGYPRQEIFKPSCVVLNETTLGVMYADLKHVYKENQHKRHEEG